MANINLLKRAQTPQTAKRRLKNILAVTLFASFALLSIFLAILFIFNLAQVAKIKDISQQIRRQEAEIAASADTEVMLRAIDDKALAIEKIVSQNYHFEEKILALQEILPADVYLGQASFTPNTFSISLTSLRLSSLNKFVESLVAQEKSIKYFNKIILEGLGFDEKEGTYRMSISGGLL